MKFIQNLFQNYTIHIDNYRKLFQKVSGAVVTELIELLARVCVSFISQRIGLSHSMRLSFKSANFWVAK
jgi:hypothetical protein